MRRQLRELDTNLPHASLYLDDIEAIIKIFSDEISEMYDAEAESDKSLREVLREKSRPADLSITTIFRIGDDEMDSISDVKEEGDTVTRLRITVEGRGPFFHENCSLSFQRWDRPSMWIVGLEGGKRWEVYAKVRAIFEKRRSYLKNLVDDFPFPLKLTGWVLLSSGLAIETILKAIGNQRLYVAFGIPYVIFGMLTILGLVISYAFPNRVYLAHPHQRSRASRETRKKYLIGTVSFVGGLLVSKLLDFILARFKTP